MTKTEIANKLDNIANTLDNIFTDENIMNIGHALKEVRDDLNALASEVGDEADKEKEALEEEK